MSQIKRYCVLKEEHEGPNAFRVHRGYILGNPYTYIKNKKTKAEVAVDTREEAIDRYERYFEQSLKLNPEFKKEFDRMVDVCMRYDVVYVGCYCAMNETCHADYIIKRLRQECNKRMVRQVLAKRKSTADS